MSRSDVAVLASVGSVAYAFVPHSSYYSVTLVTYQRASAVAPEPEVPVVHLQVVLDELANTGMEGKQPAGAAEPPEQDVAGP